MAHYCFSTAARIVFPQPVLKILIAAGGRGRIRRTCQRVSMRKQKWGLESPGDQALGWLGGAQHRRNWVPKECRNRKAKEKPSGQQPDSRVQDSLSKLGRHHRRENWASQGECHRSPTGQFPRRTGRGPPTSPSHRTWDVAGAS